MFLWYWVVWVLCIYRILTSYSHIIWKYLFPFKRLLFHFIDDFLCCTKSLLVWCSLICLFSFIFNLKLPLTQPLMTFYPCFIEAMFPFISLRWHIYFMTCSIYWYFFLKFTFSLNFQGISLLFSSLILLQNDSIFSRLPIFLCFFFICQWRKISRRRACLFERGIDFFFFAFSLQLDVYRS